MTLVLITFYNCLSLGYLILTLTVEHRIDWKHLIAWHGEPPRGVDSLLIEHQHMIRPSPVNQVFDEWPQVSDDF